MKKGLVIFSGGQDSTTVLGVAQKECDEVVLLSFNYGQRHSIENNSALNIAGYFGHDFELLKLPDNILKGTSPLLKDGDKLGKYNSVDELPGGVEPTFVPARNILFLTIASNRAYCLGVTDIYLGVCEEDFGGYWDCRNDFIQKMSIALSQGLYGNNSSINIHTPLMYKSKKDTVLLANEVFGNKFYEVFSMTHTCYDGVKYGCGQCHACILRDRGFKEAGIDDPHWRNRR